MSLSIEEEVKNMESLIHLGFEPTCREDNWLSIEADVLMFKRLFDACRLSFDKEDFTSEDYNPIEMTFKWILLLHPGNISHGLCAFMAIHLSKIYMVMPIELKHRLLNSDGLTSVVSHLFGYKGFHSNIKPYVDWDDLHANVKPYYIKPTDFEQFQDRLDKQYKELIK